MPILDHVAGQRYSQVQPHTVPEFFALQLARKLADTPSARHYLELISARSEESLLVAYRRAVAASGRHPESLARNFHVALNRVNGHGPSHEVNRLLAITVERRTVSGAILYGRHLEDIQTRH